MNYGVHHYIPTREHTRSTHVFSRYVIQHTHPAHAPTIHTPHTASPPFPPQVLLDELEGAVQGLPDHDPDDDAWRPLHQFIVIVKVGGGGRHAWYHGTGGGRGGQVAKDQGYGLVIPSGALPSSIRPPAHPTFKFGAGCTGPRHWLPIAPPLPPPLGACTRGRGGGYTGRW